jgi:hypothetical protein
MSTSVTHQRRFNKINSLPGIHRGPIVQYETHATRRVHKAHVGITALQPPAEAENETVETFKVASKARTADKK